MVTLMMAAVFLGLRAATMSLLGRANWWLPRRLDRLLPRLTVEVDTVEPKQTVAIGV